MDGTPEEGRGMSFSIDIIVKFSPSVVSLVIPGPFEGRIIQITSFLYYFEGIPQFTSLLVVARELYIEV